MKIKIKKKITVKIAPRVSVGMVVKPVEGLLVEIPIIPTWRGMTDDQKIKTYFKFEFLVCWECGKRADDSRLLGRMINDELLAVFICKTCQFWANIKQEEARDMKVKVKSSNGKGKEKEAPKEVKKESGGNGKLNGHSKGMSGLNVKDTWCLGLVKGLRKSKLSAFMGKEFPDVVDVFDGEVESRTKHFDAGKWDSRKKKLPKALLK